jgi:hypothetical protein
VPEILERMHFRLWHFLRHGEVRERNPLSAWKRTWAWGLGRPCMRTRIVARPKVGVRSDDFGRNVGAERTYVIDGPPGSLAPLPPGRGHRS